MNEAQHMLVSHPAPQRGLTLLRLPVPEPPTGVMAAADQGRLR
jgi:hypothetical protein